MLDQSHGLCEKGEIGRGLIAFTRSLEQAVKAGDSSLEQVARLELAMWQDRLVRVRAPLPSPQLGVGGGPQPDGGTVLTAGTWDRGRPTLERRHRGTARKPVPHELPVKAVAFSRDGKLLLTGGGNDNGQGGEVRLWTAGRRPGQSAPRAAFQGGGGRLRPGRRHLPDADPVEVQLWDTKGFRPRKEALFRHGKRLHGAAYSPDGKLLLTWGEDGSARLWEVATNRAVRGTAAPRGGRGSSLQPRRQLVLTGSQDCTAQLWETASAAPTGSPLKHTGPVKAVAFSTMAS